MNYIIFFLLLKFIFYVRIIVGDSMKKDIDTEFTDIDKESKYKDYIIVGILYFVVAILFVFLILGIKNQKDVVKNDIEENIQTEIKEEDKDDSTFNKNEIDILNRLG